MLLSAPEERLTMREMEFRDKAAIQQCRDAVEIIQIVDSETRRNVRQLRRVSFTGDVNQQLCSDFQHKQRPANGLSRPSSIVFVSEINRCENESQLEEGKDSLFPTSMRTPA